MWISFIFGGIAIYYFIVGICACCDGRFDRDSVDYSRFGDDSGDAGHTTYVQKRILLLIPILVISSD